MDCLNKTRNVTYSTYLFFFWFILIYLVFSILVMSVFVHRLWSEASRKMMTLWPCRIWIFKKLLKADSMDSAWLEEGGQGRAGHLPQEPFAFPQSSPKQWFNTLKNSPLKYVFAPPPQYKLLEKSYLYQINMLIKIHRLAQSQPPSQSILRPLLVTNTIC